MSSPMFNIPKTKRNIPTLTINTAVNNPPGNLNLAAANENNEILSSIANDRSPGISPGRRLKRKPPPTIDFSQINGSPSSIDAERTSSSGEIMREDITDNTSYGGSEQYCQGSNKDDDAMEGINNNNDDNNDNNSNNKYYTSSNQLYELNDDVYDKDLQDISSREWQQLAAQQKIMELSKLGEGNGGSVSKCKLTQGNKIFALKLITTDLNPDVQKQILRELQYNRKVNSDNIVKYYGTFLVDASMIGITMEFMGGKSLDAIYKRVINIDPSNRINEKVLGKIATSVLNGLNYLHQQKIIHRDIKPSNILLDFNGNVKLCDFGVSGEVVNSLATTFVGTQYYMAPERIMGKPYTVNCDVWSLGLTLLEVSLGKFPFFNIDGNDNNNNNDNGNGDNNYNGNNNGNGNGNGNGNNGNEYNIGPIELLQLILDYEPKLIDLPNDNIFWSDMFKNFIYYCLIKKTEERPSPRQMLNHPWILNLEKINVRMDKFVKQLWNF